MATTTSTSTTTTTTTTKTIGATKIISSKIVEFKKKLKNPETKKKISITFLGGRGVTELPVAIDDGPTKPNYRDRVHKVNLGDTRQF